jgi:hypothetical protein
VIIRAKKKMLSNFLNVHEVIHKHPKTTSQDRFVDQFPSQHCGLPAMAKWKEQSNFTFLKLNIVAQE